MTPGTWKRGDSPVASSQMRTPIRVHTYASLVSGSLSDVSSIVRRNAMINNTTERWRTAHGSQKNEQRISASYLFGYLKLAKDHNTKSKRDTSKCVDATLLPLDDLPPLTYFLVAKVKVRRHDADNENDEELRTAM